MAIYDEWKKDIENRLMPHGRFVDKIPSIVARCPRCHHLTISYDIDTGKLKCSNCGLEEFMPMIGEQALSQTPSKKGLSMKSLSAKPKKGEKHDTA